MSSGSPLRSEVLAPAVPWLFGRSGSSSQAGLRAGAAGGPSLLRALPAALLSPQAPGQPPGPPSACPERFLCMRIPGPREQPQEGAPVPALAPRALCPPHFTSPGRSFKETVIQALLAKFLYQCAWV